MFQIYESMDFSRTYAHLQTDEQLFIQKMRRQLAQNAYNGKPLGFKWIREKRFREKRLYYLIHNDKVLFIAFGGKKLQEVTIRHIMEERETYFKLLENL